MLPVPGSPIWLAEHRIRLRASLDRLLADQWTDRCGLLTVAPRGAPLPVLVPTNPTKLPLPQSVTLSLSVPCSRVQ